MALAVQTPRRRGLRSFLAGLHRQAGLVTGLFLVVTALTGCLLLFTEELNLRGHVALPQPRGGGRADLAPVLAEVQRTHPGHRVASVRIPEDPGLAWMVYLRDRATDARYLVHLDPATGTVVGEGSGQGVPFRRLLDLHYHYMAGTPGMVVGLGAGTALLLLSITGVWLNRRVFREMLRWRVDLRRRRPGSLLWLHQWAGAWALVLALLWGTTGLLMLVPILGKALKPAAKPGPEPAWAEVADLRAMVAEAEALHPEGRVQGISLHKSGQVRVTVFFPGAWPWDKEGQVRFTPAGERLPTPPRTLEDRFDCAVHALHFGLVGPVAKGALLAGGLLVALLPVTGALAWWLRRRRAVQGGRGEAPKG